MIYAILGATGNVGSRVANILLESGETVRAVGRSLDRLVPLRTKGAVPFTGDVTDTDFLTGALEGADGAFILLPPNARAEDVALYQSRVSLSIATALKKSGITRAVTLSSVGADLKTGTGPIRGLHELEEQLNKIKTLDVVHVRAAYFMENFLNNIGLIRTQKINGSAIRADLPMHVIATKDIAAAVAGYLTGKSLKGKSVKYLLGQRDLMMTDMTAILGKAIGRPDLKYVQFAYDDAERALIGMGISPSMARTYMEMSRAFNEGLIRKVKRTAENTTPTSFEEFAEVFADAYCMEDESCKAVGV